MLFIADQFLLCNSTFNMLGIYLLFNFTTKIDNKYIKLVLKNEKIKVFFFKHEQKYAVNYIII